MKFIADIMVGKLARYLRIAGYDVAYFNDASDDFILKTAMEEDRIVLTRDTLMLKRRQFTNGNIKSVFISDDDLKKQLIQVRLELNISLGPDLKRCLICNDPLVKVLKKDVRSKVPPYVYKTQDEFMHCKGCEKYYWRGTHYDYMVDFFKRL
ncbi:Mut7-C RNAse domain-containing protein [Actinomycetota bacterium]